jgi:hypothetical protein
LKRDYLENNYLVFIRPILEYASEVWDNCRRTNCNRLEKVQIEAARIVTGLSIYGSFDSIYKETGGKHYVQEGKLNNCYFFFFKIVKHKTLEFTIKFA